MKTITTSVSERVHIAFFGRCNSGKSSLLNALTGQEVSIVSDIPGTTTDSVTKNMELPGVGAVVLIDTAGIDDCTDLGIQRVKQTRKVLQKTDIAILILDDEDLSIEKEWLSIFENHKIPVIPVISKSDVFKNSFAGEDDIEAVSSMKPIRVSAFTKQGINGLIKAIASTVDAEKRLITAGLCESGDVVLLVMPQDAQAPKGRLIKPQVETLRELLDRGCIAMCCSVEGLTPALMAMAQPPKLIITDSQVFARVNELKPEESMLTSFSVLFARYKGDIKEFVSGAKNMMNLPPEAKILIAEACTHVPQNEDIGRVKLPDMLRKRLGKQLTIDVVGGNDFPDDLTGYDLVIHCGACMFNRRHVLTRVAQAQEQNVPITNYGIAIAALSGILDKVSY